MNHLHISTDTIAWERFPKIHSDLTRVEGKACTEGVSVESQKDPVCRPFQMQLFPTIDLGGRNGNANVCQGTSAPDHVIETRNEISSFSMDPTVAIENFI